MCRRKGSISCLLLQVWFVSAIGWKDPSWDICQEFISVKFILRRHVSADLKRISL